MTKRILVVDDETRIRQLLVLKLRSAGHEVHEAENGQRGLELARSVRPQVIFLDIMMPRMDGISVLREIRASVTDPPPKVILVTAVREEADRKKAADLGVYDYVTKPFSPRAVVDILERIEKEESGVGPAAAAAAPSLPPRPPPP